MLQVLNPTSAENLIDSQGRPYFLWDCDLTLEEFQRKLESSDSYVRAYFLGKLMRQAKPDDVFDFATLRSIRENWAEIEPFLGEKREFWDWVLKAWESLELAPS